MKTSIVHLRYDAITLSAFYLSFYFTYNFKICTIIQIVLFQAVVKLSSHETICYDEKPDFESEVRKSWAYLFLIAQKFATSLQLESCD